MCPIFWINKMKNSDMAIGLNVTFNGNAVTSESHASPRNRPGEIARVLAPEGYRYFRYQKAEEAFAIGQVAMAAALLDNADVDQAQATTTAILKGTGDFTASEFGTTFPDAYVTIDAGTGAGQTRYIKHNRGSTDYLTLDRNWDVALDTTSDYVTYSINYVSLCDTDDVSVDETPVHGVAISAVTDEQWAWFQVKGFCPLVRAIGSGDAFVYGSILTPSATAGAAKSANATLAAQDVTHAFGYVKHAYTAGDSAGLGVAAMLDCRWVI